MNGLIFNLVEVKKHSGKYVLQGTEGAEYPTAMYFRKEWFKDQSLPKQVTMMLQPTY